MVKTKNVLLNWYHITKILFKKIQMIFDIENRLWKSDFGTFFDIYFWPINKSHERNNAIFVISAIMATICNAFYQILWTWWKTVCENLKSFIGQSTSFLTTLILEPSEPRMHFDFADESILLGKGRLYFAEYICQTWKLIYL